MTALNTETLRPAARLGRAILLAVAAALLVTISEVLALVLIPDLPRAGAEAVVRFAAGAFALAFAGAAMPCLAAALLLARPYHWAVRVLAHAGRRRARLASLGLGGTSSLLVGGLFAVTVKKATAENLLVAACAAAVVAVVVTALAPVVARHVVSSVAPRARVPRLGLWLCAAAYLACYGASRLTLRGDYTSLHQLYAIGAVASAALLCLPLVERLGRRAAAAMGGLGALAIGAGIALPSASQSTRQLLFNRTGVVQYLAITASTLRGIESLPPDPAGAPSPPPAAPMVRDGAPPNVVWIMIDTLRADRLGAYEPASTLTPNLDAFARESVVFRNAWAQATNTIPSVASFLTGRHPALGVPDLFHRHRDAARDEPFFLPAPYRGFMASPPYYELAVRDVLAKDAITVLPADLGNGSDHDTITRLLGMLKQAPLPSPFMLWVPLEGPHARGDVSRRVAYVPYPLLRGEYARTYDEAVRRSDVEFGRLIAGLRELGLYDDSLIVVMADHGEALGEHADLFHAKEVYDTSTRVPLLFRLPGGAHAGHRDVVAELVDIVPTIAAFAGLAPEGRHPVSGKSLLPWITGDAAPAVREEAFTEAVFMRRKVVGYVRREADGRLWKAVHDHTNDVTELYDLTADPREAHNLADAQPERAAAMRARVRAHLAAESAPQFVPITQP